MTRNRSGLAVVGERLVREFDGLLPPGQVLSTVYRAHRLVVYHLDVHEDSVLEISEDIAQQLLRALVTRPEARTRTLRFRSWT